MKTTRWRPDTCECVIDYEWDERLSEADRVHTVVQHTPCAAHQMMLTPESRWVAVQDENTRKNRFLGEALSRVPALGETDARGSLGLKEGIEYIWSYDAGRVLHVTFTGHTMTSLQRSSLQGEADRLFGSNRVVVG